MSPLLSHYFLFTFFQRGMGTNAAIPPLGQRQTMRSNYMIWDYPQFSSSLKFLILLIFPTVTSFLTPLTPFSHCSCPHISVSYERCAFCCANAKRYQFSRAQRHISYFMFFFPFIHNMPFKLKVYNTNLIFFKKKFIYFIVHPISVNGITTHSAT